MERNRSTSEPIHEIPTSDQLRVIHVNRADWESDNPEAQAFYKSAVEQEEQSQKAKKQDS